MKSVVRRVSVAELVADVEPELISEADALSPSTYERDVADIIVTREESTWSIVDGFHRAAGLAAWCDAEGEDPTTVRVRVLDASACDPEIVAAASEPGPGQSAAIAAIEGA
jgi:hypothetical protein